MARLKEFYKKTIVPKMKKEFNYKNDLAVPRIKKIVINIGTGQALKDPKILDIMVDNLKRITGQMPIKTRARRAISSFNVKENMVVGLKVTLRDERMYDFLDKLINVALPRMKDFRGLSPAKFDGRGNYTIGIKEQIIFPEIKSDEVEKIHGLEVCLETSAKNNKEGKALLEYFGFPFEKE